MKYNNLNVLSDTLAIDRGILQAKWVKLISLIMVNSSAAVQWDWTKGLELRPWGIKGENDSILPSTFTTCVYSVVINQGEAGQSSTRFRMSGFNYLQISSFSPSSICTPTCTPQNQSINNRRRAKVDKNSHIFLKIMICTRCTSCIYV